MNTVAGHQAHHAALTHQAGGRQSAAVFHHAAQHAVGRLGRQDNEPARGQYRLAVFDQGIYRGGADQDVDQPVVAVELQGIALTSGHGHGAALLGQHHALVDHLGRQERDIAPQVRRDVALVQHRAGGALTIKAVVAL